MSSGLNKAYGILERQLQLQRRASQHLNKYTEDYNKYVSNETAMEIVNSYSQALIPRKNEKPLMKETAAKRKSVCESKEDLFHREMGGVVVYDSHARVTTIQAEPVFGHSLPGRKVLGPVRRELKQNPTFGKSQSEATIFESVPDYPPKKPPREDYSLLVPSANILRFNSKFESGNLRKAVKISETEYSLLLDFDTETQSHTQWFYFSVQNCYVGQSVKFTISNLGKSDSLYQKGLKPLVYSVAKSNQTGVGWHRDGHAIMYEPSTFPGGGITSRYHQLSFRYTFHYPDDLVYFAHCYPYTYTDLCRDLDVYKLTPGAPEILRIDTLCETVGHNPCPVLTITEDIGSYPAWSYELDYMCRSAAGRKLARMKEAKQRKVNEGRCPQLDSIHKSKKGVVLMARVHPGESNSSYMMKGALDFLLSDTHTARLLRRHYVFKVVPMLNPDGVVYGNTRTSLLGADLNRRWAAPSKILHPTLYYTKRMVQAMAEEREIALVCDMHGHSIKPNVFMYGCRHEGYDLDSRKRNALIKLLPLLLSRRTDLFSFPRCHFRIEKSREATSRVVFFKEIGIERSYTLEATFFGPSGGGLSHMNEHHFELIGKELCELLLSFTNRRAFRGKLEEAIQHLRRIKTKLKVPEPEKAAKAVKFTEEKLDPEPGFVSEREEAADQFSIAEVMSDLSAYEEELNVSSASDESEGTESSASSSDDRKVSCYAAGIPRIYREPRENKSQGSLPEDGETGNATTDSQSLCAEDQDEQSDNSQCALAFLFALRPTAVGNLGHCGCLSNEVERRAIEIPAIPTELTHWKSTKTAG